jgi:hypothetical protein
VGLIPLKEYELIIGIEDFIDKIFKKLGKKEIEFGDEVFDHQYLIHSNDPEFTCQMLTGMIRGKIIGHSVYNLSYLTDKKKNTSELISVVSRTIEDMETYLDLVMLHQLLIDKLAESGIISC